MKGFNMKKNIFILFMLSTSILYSQNIFKKTFKYSTIYGAYSQTNAIQDNKSFYVTQENDLIETTERNPADYIWSIGWRKLANFQYEDRNKFYDGSENNVGTKSNIGNTKGLEYLIEYSKGRQQGDMFENKEAFVRYLAKWWLVKGEYKFNELVDIDYTSAEARLRIPLGKKLSLSSGIIYRKAQKAYGHNPIQKYLEENPWWVLAYDFAGHTDMIYEMIDPISGASLGYDYQWFDQQGNLISSSDLDYRNSIFEDVVNAYNEIELAKIAPHEYASIIAGLDFYHYRKSFWVHAYGNVLPKHKLISGDDRYWYGRRNGDNWLDYSFGGVFGFKIGKVGVFSELNMQRYWGKKIKIIKCGLNFRL
jgi:hypothetical protein